MDYVSSLRREFVENRERFLREGAAFRPIVGYYCWALGFLDRQGKKIGCLLHPRQNDGLDLRYLIDYGAKCKREICFEGKNFDLLPPQGRRFWLELAKGLNSFFFSSRRANPLFHILLWGPELLEQVRMKAEHCGLNSTEILAELSFLVDSSWNPQAHRYLFRILFERASSKPRHADSLDALNDKLHISASEFLAELQNRISAKPPGKTGGRLQEFTHNLSMKRDFLDFLRLALGVRTICKEDADRMQSFIETHLPRLIDC